MRECRECTCRETHQAVWLSLCLLLYFSDALGKNFKKNRMGPI